MRKLFLAFAALAAIFALPQAARAQTQTYVSGTVTGSDSIAWAGAQISASIVSPGGASLSLTPCTSGAGCPVANPATGGVQAGGAFGMNLWANGSILPAGTTYTFIATINGLVPPVGSGPQTCTVTGVTVAGATQTVNLTGCPALTNIVASSSGVTSVSAGNLSPLFTSSVATPTTTPALSFALSNAPANEFFGNCTGSPAPPAYCSIVPSGGTFNVLSYGAENDGRTCNVDANSGSPILTPGGSNPCTFLTTDPSRLAWVMNPATNALICGTSTATQTIVSESGGASAILSANCNATLTDGTALAYIGSDSLPGWQGACTAMIAANGGLIFAPTGIYMWGIDASLAGACRVATNYTGGAVGFVGTTQDGTLIYPAPWYSHPSTGGYFFNLAQGGSASIFKNFTMDGYFYANGSGLLGQLIAADFPQVDAITLRNFNLHQVAEIETVANINPNVNIPVYVRNSVLCPAPLETGTGTLTFNQEPYQEADVSNDEFCTAGYSFGAIDMTGGTVNLFGNRITATAANEEGISTENTLTGAVNLNVFGTVICSNGNSGFTAINQSSNSVSNPAIFNVQNLQVDGNRCPNAAGANVTDFSNSSFGSITVLNDVLNANGTGVVFSNAGKVFDQGGNAAAGGAGVLSGAGALFGSASITGIAQTAANITPSTGWGTSGAAGNGVSAVSGSSQLMQFTITAAGVPTLNPTVAVVFPVAFLSATNLICSAAIDGSLGSLTSGSLTTSAITTTGLTLTASGTPTAAQAYQIQVGCKSP